MVKSWGIPEICLTALHSPYKIVIGLRNHLKCPSQAVDMRIYPLPFIFLLISFIAACSPEPEQPTPTSVPTPTPTPFPAPDLAPILLRKNNLPTQATSAEISYTPHPSFDKVPSPPYFISALYANGPEFAGRISFFFYANPQILDAAWTAVLETVVTPKEVTGLGELAVVDFSDVVFIRCQTLIHLKLAGTNSEEPRLFAEQLDAQLTPLLCQSSPYESQPR